MRLTLVMVMSADGKTTHSSITHGWSSKEDQEHFCELKSKFPVVIMGRKTYESVKNDLHITDNPKRIVMTKQPSFFALDTVPGKLEFTSDNPRIVLQKLESQGHQGALLVGGSNLNEAFLSAHLITDCYITVEPKFFGNGKDIFTSDPIDVSLQLISVKQLNEQGTMLLHYKILYDR